MVTLEVLNPCGAVVSSKAAYAPRLPDLDGKTICLLSNQLGEADRIFPAIRESLQKRYPTANIVPYSEMPQGGDRIDSEAIVAAVKSQGGQAVIVGNAQ